MKWAALKTCCSFSRRTRVHDFTISTAAAISHPAGRQTGPRRSDRRSCRDCGGCRRRGARNRNRPAARNRPRRPAGRCPALARRWLAALLAISGPHLRAIRLSPCWAISVRCVWMIVSVSDQPLLAAGDQAQAALRRARGESLRRTAGRPVAIGRGPHGGEQVGRRLAGHVHRFDLSHAARLGQADRLIDEPAIVGDQFV